MRKTYIRPCISFDSFALNSCIASGCEMIGSNQEPHACPVLIPSWEGVSIFMEAAGCDLYPPEGMDTICYHVPTADNNVFGS